MTAARIAHELHGRKSGAGYIAKCVAHEDVNPSLSISEQDGRILVHCHAGCEQAAVIAALRDLGLWPEPEERHGDDIEALYDYTDEDGKLLYQIVRKRGKKFLQRFPDRDGGWTWKKHPQQVPYHLPEIIEAAIVSSRKGNAIAKLCGITVSSPRAIAAARANGGRNSISFSPVRKSASCPMPIRPAGTML